jgi:hypothetical protein
MNKILVFIAIYSLQTTLFAQTTEIEFSLPVRGLAIAAPSMHERDLFLKCRCNGQKCEKPI